MPKAARGAEPLHEQILRAAAPRVRQRRGREAEGDAEERDGGYVGPRLARRILREARRQQEELEAEHGPGAPARPPPPRCATPGGSGSEEDEEDEEWPSLRRAAEWDGRSGGGDVEVDPEDEKALEAFMSRAPPLRCGAGGGGGGGERTGSPGSSAPTPPGSQADAGGCNHGEDHGEADGGADGAVGAVGPPHASARPPRAGGVQRRPRGEGTAGPRPHTHLCGTPTPSAAMGSSRPRRGSAAASLRAAVDLVLMGRTRVAHKCCPVLSRDSAQPLCGGAVQGADGLLTTLRQTPAPLLSLKVLSKYRSGKLPKAFKIIPALSNWEQILYITEPETWTAAAMYQATRCDQHSPL